MYTNSNRHRMSTHQTKVNKLKEGDDVLYSCEDMIGSGKVFKIKEFEIIVQTSNAAQGLEYVHKSNLIFN